MAVNKSCSGIQTSKLCPRLLHLIKWPDSDFYGFRDEKKGREYPYIENVYRNSPAFATGLTAGDKIIEVNGTNVQNDTVEEYDWRIMENPNEVRLLVLSFSGFRYYKCRNINPSGSMDGIFYKITPKSLHLNPHLFFSTIFQYVMTVVAQILSWDACDENLDSNTKELFTFHVAPLRILHLTIWNGGDTFGFNVETKGPGKYFVSKVEKNSIADSAGLQLGDWIIELNGVNVSKYSRNELLQKLNKDQLELELLILNESAFNFYKSNGITPSRYSNGIIYKQNPNPFRSTTLSSGTNPEGNKENIKKIMEDQSRIPENFKSTMEFSIANPQGIKSIGVTKDEITLASCVDNDIATPQSSTSESNISLLESKLQAMDEKLSRVVGKLERNFNLDLVGNLKGDVDDDGENDSTRDFVHVDDIVDGTPN